MSERSNSDAELRIIEDGKESEERRELGKANLIGDKTAVILTEMLKSGKLNQSSMGSFTSLSSEQSSNEEEENIVVSSTDKVKILRFEDTLSKEDCKYFKIIYESLLLEGRAGNLTRSTFEMVLAQKPPTWLQVMHERLKHLIISSETFQSKMKMGYGAWIETKLDEMNRSVGEREQEEFQTTNASYSPSRDRPTDKGTMGIINE